MLRTLGEVAEQLRRAEAAKHDAFDVKHAPSIGLMYEGLTPHLGPHRHRNSTSKVVGGFAVDDDGNTTRQLDCMLARGSGTPVPYDDGCFGRSMRGLLADGACWPAIFMPLAEMITKPSAGTELS